MGLKIDLYASFFAYGGNGGVSSQIPEIGAWWAKALGELRADDRIGRVAHKTYSDTPITMTRNRAIKDARDAGFDAVLMIDSDNVPDLYLGKDPFAKPFLSTSLDFLYERSSRGLPTVIGAPYCGPPPHPTQGGEENVYVFYWADRETDNLGAGFNIEAYSRHESAVMDGIHPAAALPTGTILFTTDVFEEMKAPWFYYEYEDKYETHKASTEDITCTRDISQHTIGKYGHSAVFCNWSAWSGHYKPKCVGRPKVVYAEQINDRFRKAVLQDQNVADRIVHVDVPDAGVDASEQPAASSNGEQVKKGPPVQGRFVGGRVVKTIGEAMDRADLKSLESIVKHLGQVRNNAPLRLFDVKSWIGESAVVLDSASPEGSLVYAVDNFIKCDEVGCSAEDAKKMLASNCGESYKVSIRPIQRDSLDAAIELDRQDADMVFINDPTEDDIDVWQGHCRQDGLLCGTNFAEVQGALSEKFGEDNVRVFANSGVWTVVLAGVPSPEEEADVAPSESD